MSIKGRTIPIKQVGGNREAELVSQGWVRKTTMGEPRLSELVENYRTMGYEVHVEAFRAQGESCNTCFDAGEEMGQAYGTVYVRKSESARGDDELF
ncbi:MAG: hypothetical protein WBP72_12855 [Rhodocyclaceae bacterium]